MTETLSIKKNQSNIKDINPSYKEETEKKKLERKKSINSSNYESSFNNLNSEIKSIIENETDLSFSSNSNSEIDDENKTNLEHLFDSKYWQASKDINSETDEPNSTYESQNEKGTPSKKENIVFFDKKNAPTPFHSKYAEKQEMAGMSEGSNKQSTQSNEEEEARTDHLNNISYCESNNNISPINSLGNNDSDNENKKEKGKEKLKINIKEDKINTENNKDNNINNNLNTNKK